MVVEKGVITAVVEDARAPRGNGVDLAGHTLLPGLINCHVHLCFGAEADPVRPLREEPLALTAIKALLRARETARAGVTTVRDLGGREYVEIAARRAIQEGLIDGPRIVAAGRPVCMTGGHGHWLGREADGPDDARKAVREQLKAGADVIKIIATGGVMTPGVEPGSPQMTLRGDARGHRGGAQGGAPHRGPRHGRDRDQRGDRLRGSPRSSTASTSPRRSWPTCGATGPSWCPP